MTSDSLMEISGPTTVPLDRSGRAWRRLRANWSARIGALLVLAVCVLGVGANYIAPYDPDARDRSVSAPSGPTSQHWLGLDADQKDVLSRVVFGTRLSLLAGLFSMLVAIALGVPLGILAGYFGSWSDSFIMRSVDIALAFPSILIALLVAIAFKPGWTAIILAVGLISVPMFVRQVRATVLTIRHLDYVEASRALGATSFHILSRSILPGVVNPTVVLATLGLGAAILEVAGLSFLGIGGDPTEPEWGSMLAQAKQHLGQSIWPALGPGIAITVSILGFNLLGDALRDALDPKNS